MTTKLKVITIGVYGFDEPRFYQKLLGAQVDTFCDIRRRRGVRGAEYRFANSQRLQAGLANVGIRYLHRLDLAPSLPMRALQTQADQAGKIAKRQRSLMSSAFVAAYQRECLADFDPQSLLAAVGPNASVLALCCVEREPAACHRSLVAAWLQQAWECTVEHLLP